MALLMKRSFNIIEQQNGLMLLDILFLLYKGSTFMFSYLSPIEYLGLRLLSTIYHVQWGKNHADLFILFNTSMKKKLGIYGLSFKDITSFPSSALTRSGRRVPIGIPYISGSKGSLFH